MSVFNSNLWHPLQKHPFSWTNSPLSSKCILHEEIRKHNFFLRNSQYSHSLHQKYTVEQESYKQFFNIGPCQRCHFIFIWDSLKNISCFSFIFSLWNDQWNISRILDLIKRDNDGFDQYDDRFYPIYQCHIVKAFFFMRNAPEIFSETQLRR